MAIQDYSYEKFEIGTAKAAIFVFLFTILCGVVYIGAITGLAQILFPKQANGNIIAVDGKKYGSELLDQQFIDEKHMWGRIMNIDINMYKKEDGTMLFYAAPSNFNPASEEYSTLVAERV